VATVNIDREKKRTRWEKKNIEKREKKKRGKQKEREVIKGIMNISSSTHVTGP
jgi:hypothetical protein